MPTQVIKILRSTTNVASTLTYGAPAFSNISTEGRFFVGDSTNTALEISRNRVLRQSFSANTVLTKRMVVDAGTYLTFSANLLTASLPSVTSGDNGLIATVGNDSTATYSFTLNSNDAYLINGYSSVLLNPGEYLRLVFNFSLTQWEVII